MPAPSRRIRVGTASWTDKTLLESGAFYPRAVRTPEQRLRYYAERFGVVEVDATYYALPSVRNAVAWVERTPPDFRFGVKAYAAMTGHPVEPARLDRDLQAALPANVRRARSIEVEMLPDEIRDEVWRRFRAGIDPLVQAGKLAYVLLQLPPWFGPDDQSRAWVEDGGERLAGVPCAVEFRHAGWMAPERAPATLGWLGRRRLAYVAVDEPQGTRSSVPPIAEATTDALAVVRFHGRKQDTWTKPGVPTTVRFRYDYARAELAEWVPKIRTLARKSGEVLVLMNNCYRDYAVRNAVELATLLEGAKGDDA